MAPTKAPVGAWPSLSAHAMIIRAPEIPLYVIFSDFIKLANVPDFIVKEWFYYIYTGFHRHGNGGAYLQLCPDIGASQESELWASDACSAQQNRGNTTGSRSQQIWPQSNTGTVCMYVYIYIFLLLVFA